MANEFLIKTLQNLGHSTTEKNRLDSNKRIKFKLDDEKDKLKKYKPQKKVKPKESSTTQSELNLNKKSTINIEEIIEAQVIKKPRRVTFDHDLVKFVDISKKNSLQRRLEKIKNELSIDGNEEKAEVNKVGVFNDKYGLSLKAKSQNQISKMSCCCIIF